MRRMQRGLTSAFDARKLWEPSSINPFSGVSWSPAFIGFLIFVVGFTTSRVTLGTAAMVTALATLPLEKRRLRIPSVAILPIVIVGWALIGYIVSDYPDTVIDAIRKFVSTCLVVLVAVNVVTSRARLRVVLFLVLVSFVAYPMRGTLGNYAIGNTYGGRAAWQGAYADPNDTAALCILQLSLVLGALEIEKSKLMKLWIIGCAILLPLMVLLTQSRGATIALVAFALVVFRNSYRDVKKLFFGLVAVGALLFFAPKTVWNRLSSLQNIQTVRDEGVDLNTDASSSTAQRLEIWRVAVAVIWDNPIFGVGFGAYPLEHGKRSRDAEFDVIARGKRATHSTYLELLAEQGIVGTGLFIAVVAVTIKGSWRARKRAPKELHYPMMQLLYMEIGLYGFLVAGIWGSFGRFTPTYFHLALMYISAQLLEEDGQRLKQGPAAVQQMRGMPLRAQRIARSMAQG